jgi:hypothetical protein
VFIGAGTPTNETGVGAVAGYGLASIYTSRILANINKASKIIQTAGMVILGAFGGVVTFTDRGGDLSAVPLPATAYQPLGA